LVARGLLAMGLPMSQPTTYVRAFNFTNQQAVTPSDPLPADKVDLEFNLVKTSLDETQANLALIQRDDGAVKNNSIGYDQLKAELNGFGFNPPAPWATATNYIARDTVFQGSGFYQCLVSHISGVFATDLAAGKWLLVADFTAATTAAAASAAAALVSQNAAVASATTASNAATSADADAIAAAADRVQTGLDATATAADRVQTGLDATATAADRVQTGSDKTATAADRVQTGLDRTAAANSAATLDLRDGAFRLKNSADQTKLLAFDLSGLSAATTRSLTAQDKSGTIALVGDDIKDTVAFADNAAPTKKARLEVSAVTAGQTRIINVPDRDVYLGRGWELIDSVSLAAGPADASFLNAQDSAFVEQMLVLENVCAAGSVDLHLLVSINGGSSYITSGYLWARSLFVISAAPAPSHLGSISDSKILICNNTSATVSDGGVSGQLRFMPNLLGDQKIEWDVIYNTSANRLTTKGLSFVNTAANALRLQPASGNFKAGGAIHRYGLRK